jgi:hypothetical protein
MIQAFSQAEDALLRATLRDGDEAIEAFAEWRALFDFEGEHEAGEFRLLPLLHANLARLGVKDPIMGRLRGIHRHAWAEGQRRQRSAGMVLRLLAGAGIPTMFTKGLALAQDYYPDPSLRPMQDIDLLVPRDRAEGAIEILREAGWHFTDTLNAYSLGGGERAAFMTLNNGLGMRDGLGNEVDVHWQALHECAVPFLSDWFWADTEPLAISGQESVRPGPGPLLFHVISHGLRPNPMSPLRWVADATMILKRSGSDIDWSKFWQMARRARLEVRLAKGLTVVERISKCPLPSGAKKSATMSAIELLETNAFRRARLGQYPALSLLFLRIAKLLRLSSGTDRLVMLILLRQWLTPRWTVPDRTGQGSSS